MRLVTIKVTDRDLNEMRNAIEYAIEMEQVVVDRALYKETNDPEDKKFWDECRTNVIKWTALLEDLRAH